MSQVRPKVLITYGRINAPLQIPLSDALLNVPQTFLTVNTAASALTLSVKNSTGFNATTTPFVLIGEPGNQGSEILPLSSVTNISTVVLQNTTSFPHSAGTVVYALAYDSFEILGATGSTGTKNKIAISSFHPSLINTPYTDTTQTWDTYFARFYNSRSTGPTASTGATASGFSAYSDPAPLNSYSSLSARSIIDTALAEIDKSTSQTLTDEFAFQMLDMCQTEVLRELKRWSFMQKFDAIIGKVATGSWKIPVPDDLDDQNTNKSVYQIRIGTQQRLIWVDKEKFDEFFIGVAYTTLASAVGVGDATITLSDSSDFEDTGTVTIGAYNYGYTANDTTTGVLTLSVVVPTGEGQPVGADVFQGVTQGLPTYWTTYGGYIYYSPATQASYDGHNIYMDYYIKQSRIQKDSDEIIFPDPSVAVAYLCWKFLKKLSSGSETPDSQAYQGVFERRKSIMKNKEVMNRTFKMKARLQNFSIQSQFNEGTPRYIRDANFPNTGF